MQRHVVGHSGATLRTVARHVVDAGKVDAETRLSIYASGYQLRLVEALGTEFETLKVLAGEAGFDRLCRSFIAAHPSRTPNLRWYGDKLPATWPAPHRSARRPRAD